MHKEAIIPGIFGFLTIGIILFWLVSLLVGLTDSWFSYSEVSIRAQGSGASEFLSLLMCYVSFGFAWYMWQAERKNLALGLLLIGLFYNPFFSVSLGDYDRDFYPWLDTISLAVVGYVAVYYADAIQRLRRCAQKVRTKIKELADD